MNAGIEIAGESGYGVYYNTFRNLISGDYADGNGEGFVIRSLSSMVYIAGNVFINCKAGFNYGHGWDIDFANNSYIGAQAEKNDLYGFMIDNTYASEFVGGYSESNHQNWATAGVSDSTDDESFYLTSASAGVKIIGGRHVGDISGDTHMPGNVFMPTQKPWSLGYDETGKLKASSITLRVNGSGIGIGGANPYANAINFSAGSYAGFLLSGSWYVLFNPYSQVIQFYKPLLIQQTLAGIYAGYGSPEGVMSASPGSIYLDTSGGPGYYKNSGTGSTGWVSR